MIPSIFKKIGVSVYSNAETPDALRSKASRHSYISAAGRILHFHIVFLTHNALFMILIRHIICRGICNIAHIGDRIPVCAIAHFTYDRIVRAKRSAQCVYLIFGRSRSTFSHFFRVLLSVDAARQILIVI